MAQNVFITGGSRGIGAGGVLAFAQKRDNGAFVWPSSPAGGRGGAAARPGRAAFSQQGGYLRLEKLCLFCCGSCPRAFISLVWDSRYRSGGTPSCFLNTLVK